jgi:hypothetical protein
MIISIRHKLFAWLIFPVLVAASPAAAAVFQSGAGRFEVSAWDAEVAREVTAAAEDAWRMLATPLGLPEAFSSPVFLRVVRAAEWPERSPFLTQVEPGGVVSVRLGWPANPSERATDRAVVQGLLMRLAVSQHGVSDTLAVPLWLELGCVGWWRARAEGAQWDALKYEARRRRLPRLQAILSAQRGGAETRELEVGASWLLAVLLSESGRTAAWPQLLRRLLHGEAPESAVDVVFGDRFHGESERELWWRTAFEQAWRTRTLPGLDAEESRRALENLARFVVWGESADRLIPLAEVLAHGHEPFVAAELSRRATEAGRLAAAAHPFFRNAALSLSAALNSGSLAPEQQAKLIRAFQDDWRDGMGLVQASAAALDAFEAARR